MTDISRYVPIISGIGAQGFGGAKGLVSNIAIFGVPGPAFVGTPYSFTPTVINSVGPLVFILIGNLPPGLSFNTQTGNISGTPTQAGGFHDISITVRDQLGEASLTDLTIDVGNTPPYSPSLDFSNLLNSQYIGQVV